MPKLTFPSLDATIKTFRESRVQLAWICSEVKLEDGAWTTGIPYLASRVVVTAVIDKHLWAEWRYWVGRGMAEGTVRGLRVPDWLQQKSDQKLAEISKRIDDAGFEIREGMICHSRMTLDTFRL
ncbi:MAG: hypothetical protein ACREKS_02465 [Candidatus Rokuibacteriota bacterium]